MAVPGFQDPRARRSLWPRWALATALGSTLGATMGGVLITAWLQPFEIVSSPLEVAAIGIPRVSGALGIWGAGMDADTVAAAGQGSLVAPRDDWRLGHRWSSGWGAARRWRGH